ncbi:ATP-binding cassette domain-containing protein [Candidatus Caldatribacterium saccharofermentans]|uniref:ATP-binding cassette domain-containing protein n=1 Tax=Candidatus Caldatribacterium saccharofermentans TaxID=1454753 RepID=UPI003D040304
MSTERGQILLEARNIVKKFGGVVALRGVNFKVHYQEIVGLVGDNGAGKSTLIKVISGVYPPEEGEIYFEGHRVFFSTPREARDAGIETVYQDLALAPNMDASMNVFIGREVVRRDWKVFRTLDKKKMFEETKRVLRDILGVHVEDNAIRSPVLSLSGGQRQCVAIARAIYSAPKLLIMDEPTAAISVKERRKVLDLMLNLKQRGISIIFISHTLEEIFSVADRIVVLNRGNLVRDVPKEQTSIEDVVTAMVSGSSQNSDLR